MLRMEDLDAPRVVPGSAESILRDLEWLGLDWDGPVVVQSTRRDAIWSAAELLVHRGLAYPCVCSRGDLRRAASAPQGGDAEPRYPGTCRDRFATLKDAERVSGKPAALRFRVAPGPVSVVDGFAGTFTEDVGAEVGDFLIARKGGAPAYQLAVVVDDAADGVTEVVRGDDLLPSALRQTLLQRALGLPHPEYQHVPLVVDGEGRRLAKRADDLSLETLRHRGVDPRTIVAWAARTSGMERAERPTAAALLPDFSMARVPKTPVDGAAAIGEFRP